VLVITYVLVLLVACATARGSTGWPTSGAAMRWRPPVGFIGHAWCVHRHESVDWHRRWLDYLGRPSRYAGGLQFLESTWRRAGGTGEPWQWSPREQIYRAWRIVTADRGSWSEWGTRRRCGLR
jgi:hypothetical protein